MGSGKYRQRGGTTRTLTCHWLEAKGYPPVARAWPAAQQWRTESLPREKRRCRSTHKPYRDVVAALFVITRKLKMMQSHSVDEWKNYNYTGEWHPAIYRKERLVHTITAFDGSPRVYAELKKPDLTGYILCAASYMAFIHIGVSGIKPEGHGVRSL